MKHAKTFVAMLVTVFLASGCPVPGTQSGTGTVDHGKKPVMVEKPITPPKLEWGDGSIFVPTTQLTTCQIGSEVIRIFLPDNQVTTPNQYYHAPYVSLEYVRNGQARPPSEFELVNKDLNIDLACKQTICKARGLGENCTVVLSPLPVSFIQVSPQEGHPANAAYRSGWRKQFPTDQIVSGKYRVVLSRTTKTDDVQYCPIPMTIGYRFKAFKGSVPPQLVLDLRSVMNSQEFNRLSQKVTIGAGTEPTLVTPYQVQKLVVKQVTHSSRYTINMFDESGNYSQFMKDVESKFTQGIENILDANLKVNLQRFARLSKELVSGADLQQYRDTINSTINNVNSAQTNEQTRTAMSKSESWNIFSVIAKGSLEYLGLSDQPAKWTNDEWQKFVSYTSSIFNWEQKQAQEQVWRIRAINLFQLSTTSQEIARSVHTAKFTLDGLSYVNVTHAMDVECKGVPNDKHCDAGEKKGEGETCGADCGCCWTQVIIGRKTHTQPFHVTSRIPARGKCITERRQECVKTPSGTAGIITKINYKCVSGENCKQSFHTTDKGGDPYHDDVSEVGHPCFTWGRRWCSRTPIVEVYTVEYYTGSNQSFQKCSSPTP